MSSFLSFAPAFAHTKPHHPENAQRLANFMPRLERSGAMVDLELLESTSATKEQILRAHTPDLLEQVQSVSRSGGGLLDWGDTYATAVSYDLALEAAGSACTAVSRIVSGAAKNGLVLARPPGHHAESDRPGGFCLFNNIAIAARQAQADGAGRVMILDIDVHHGNGTQEIFYEDDTVLFLSAHLLTSGFYPGSGRANEQGEGRGYGFTVNAPLPPYVGDLGYGRLFANLFYPKAVAFNPEIILVSIGFDAHWQDPLSFAGLSLTGYAQLCRRIIETANRLCNGRVLFLLEGGYQPDVLTSGALNLLFSLMGQDQIEDPFGSMSRPEEDISNQLEALQRRHLLS